MYIVSVEGIDASGKQTQVEMMVEELMSQGYKVATESFPRYNLPIGNVLKRWFSGEIQLTDEAVHMLLEADRHDFMREIERLKDEQYDFLILDRFTLSNLAYGVNKGLDYDWLRNLQVGLRQPDITFVLDISAETSIKRKLAGRDRHEVDHILLNRARTAYNVLANRLSEDEDQLIYVIDANQITAEQIHEVIMSYLSCLTSPAIE